MINEYTCRLFPKLNSITVTGDKRVEQSIGFTYKIKESEEFSVFY